jgi:DNA-binding SARP family transcriptional activator
MDFQLLGPLEVSDGGREIAVSGRKRRALLALLLLHRNEVVPADRLIDELWDGRPPATAAKGLQVHVSQLRKELLAGGESADGVALLTRAGGYVLEVAGERLDIVRFERAVAAAEAARADGRVDEAASRLDDALALWRGPPLVDFSYEAFAQDEIARLEELRLVALEERVDADLALGRHPKVIAELEGLVHGHPLRERLRAQLMLALYRCGRQGAALEAYREARRVSLDELGLEPGTELRELEAAILAESPALAPPPRLPVHPKAVRRSALALVAAGVLLAGAALGALLIGGEQRAGSAPPALDLAPNSILGLSATGGQARFAVPLPGRATDLAAEGDRLFAVTIDSSALSIVDGRTRRLSRTVPLPMRPGAVAVAGDDVWVADGRRGLLVRLEAGYEEVVTRVTWPRPPRREAVGLSRFDPTGVAVAAGAAWATDGTSRLVRADSAGRVARVRAPHPLDGIAAGAGALWAFSRRDAAVVRIDPRTSRVTDVVRVVARPGAEAPAPIAIAATAADVWVLNGNTATLSRIDARTRGITATVALALEASPRDVDASNGAVWVSHFDGSVTRVPVGGGEPRSTFLGTSLVGVAGSERRVWVAGVALDQHIPGGEP